MITQVDEIFAAVLVRQPAMPSHHHATHDSRKAYCPFTLRDRHTRQAVLAHPMVATVVLQKVPNPERNFFVREEQQELSRRISLIARRKGLFWTLLGLTTFFAFMIRSPYIGCVAEDGAAAPPITDCAGVYGCFDSSATCPFTARTG